jgi:hypothetical protein
LLDRSVSFAEQSAKPGTIFGKPNPRLLERETANYRD